MGDPNAKVADMLDQLTIESFEPLVGTSFWLHDNGHKVELRLTSAARVMESEAARLKRTPFSLFFVAPLLLPQKIYHVTHDAFAEPLDIFLVPVSRQGDVYMVEAVFT
jgi:hypothetical protein